MALITHPSQGQYQTALLRPQPWSQGSKRRSFVNFQRVDKTVITSLQHCSYSRPHSINTSQRKPFQILSFKGSEQNVKSDHSDNCSKFTNPLIHPDVHNHRITYSSEDRECSTTGSPSIQKLFRKWLLLLQIQTSAQEDEILSENMEVSEKPEESQTKVALKGEALKFLKSGAANFLKLDAAITLPIIIIIPFYLSVRLMYGSEVTKELTPLWVLGPFIIALYVKIIQALCSLYVFCFIAVITLVKNLPSYYLSVSSYISEGKLKEFLWVRFVKPIEDVKNMNCRLFFARKMKQVQEWAVEKYLDYVESIWPYYCRTIRFLKKANLI